VLVRDVTEVRRRDRALLSKDATIREIHHRVKNNLQTVAALLRMQARRSADPSVQQALNESVRRVTSIAMVHETLSTSPDDRVDLDQIVDRLVPMISDVAAAETSARVRRSGTFGDLGAELATPLVMVLAEVVQNALQHAFVPESPGGQVLITVERSAKELKIVVTDDGIGLPEGFTVEKASGLGLQIVRTLVEAELLGSIEMGERAGVAGTSVQIVLPLRGRS
jgi:two-component sensor histidine kinase